MYYTVVKTTRSEALFRCTIVRLCTTRWIVVEAKSSLTCSMFVPYTIHSIINEKYLQWHTRNYVSLYYYDEGQH